jgi:hypothetical protein
MRVTFRYSQAGRLTRTTELRQAKKTSSSVTGRLLHLWEYMFFVYFTLVCKISPHRNRNRNRNRTHYTQKNPGSLTTTDKARQTSVSVQKKRPRISTIKPSEFPLCPNRAATGQSAQACCQIRTQYIISVVSSVWDSKKRKIPCCLES